MKNTRVLVVATLFAILAACGQGGDETPSAAGGGQGTSRLSEDAFARAQQCLTLISLARGEIPGTEEQRAVLASGAVSGPVLELLEGSQVHARQHVQQLGTAAGLTDDQLALQFGQGIPPTLQLYQGEDQALVRDTMGCGLNYANGIPTDGAAMQPSAAPR